MMDSKSVVVVKAKYRLSISICIPLSGKVVLASYQIEIRLLVAAGPILPFLAGVVRTAPC